MPEKVLSISCSLYWHPEWAIYKDRKNFTSRGTPAWHNTPVNFH
jgi:hypothetical protein